MKNHAENGLPLKLKMILFEEQMLPNWAQLLDLAARLTALPEESQEWFSRFTNSAGTDDAVTVLANCTLLRLSLLEKKEAIVGELQRNHDDTQASQIISAWLYALDTMIQEARSRKTCAWSLEGLAKSDLEDSPGGDINLRRV